MIPNGEMAPDFEVRDHQNRTVRLRELRGRRVLLWFYPEADTPGCTKEGCGFRDLKTQLDDKGVEILGISFDPPEKNAAFAEKFKFPYRLLSDTDRKVGRAYGALADPDAPRARRVSYLIASDGRIERSYGFGAKMDAEAHPTEVLRDVTYSPR